MDDLTVVAFLVAKDGHEEVVRLALRDLVTPTRGEEGCLA